MLIKKIFDQDRGRNEIFRVKGKWLIKLGKSAKMIIIVNNNK